MSEPLVAYLRGFRESKSVYVLEQAIEQLGQMGSAAETAIAELAAICSCRIDPWPERRQPTPREDNAPEIPETGEGWMGGVDWAGTGEGTRIRCYP